MTKPFVTFGAAHLIAIALATVMPLALGAAVRRRGSSRIRDAIRLALATELIATWVLWYGLIFARGWLSPQTILPMDLCDWAVIAAIVTLLRPNQATYELTYFWSLSGTMQALLTPELFYGFPDLRFIVFFGFHGGAIAAAVYLTVGLRYRPVGVSIPRVLGWSIVYLATALAVNGLFHTNFGYLSAKPARASLLDLMAPWPFYIGEMAALGVVLVIVLYLPFFVFDRWRGNSAST
ncbi:MAG TPA: TIGR02206 family membrane protein [Rhizomicrobium sp.]|jgi:hypothetical integral membrane protein (TIGR02206 family)